MNYVLWATEIKASTNRHQYRQQLIEFEPCIAGRMARMGNETQMRGIAAWQRSALSNSIVQDTTKTLKYDLLPRTPYLPRLAPSDDHFFWSMAHSLAGTHLVNFEEAQNWLDKCYAKNVQLGTDITFSKPSFVFLLKCFTFYW